MYVVNDTLKTVVFNGVAFTTYSVRHVSDSFVRLSEFVRRRSSGDFKVFSSKFNADSYLRFRLTLRFMDKNSILARIKDPEAKVTIEKLLASKEFDPKKVMGWAEAIKLKCNQVNITSTFEYSLARAIAGKLSFSDIIKDNNEETSDAKIGEAAAEETKVVAEPAPDTESVSEATEDAKEVKTDVTTEAVSEVEETTEPAEAEEPVIEAEKTITEDVNNEPVEESSESDTAVSEETASEETVSEEPVVETPAEEKPKKRTRKK